MIYDLPRSIQTYLEDIDKTPLLSPDDEIDLGRRVRSGDESAIEVLVQSNLRFVYLIAKEYEGRGLPLADLVSEGNLGLIKAAKRFDETRGFKFITYAVWWIKQSIQQALEQQADTVRIPSHHHRIRRRYNKIFSRLQQKSGSDPSLDDIAINLDIDASDLSALFQNKRDLLYLDRPFGDDGARMIEFIKDESSESPETRLLKESLQNDLAGVFSKLKPKQATVLRMVFGFETGVPMSLREIGRRLKISAERVRQIKEEALERLRSRKNAEVLRAYL